MGKALRARNLLGPPEGRKAFTLQTRPAFSDDGEIAVAKAAGFSLLHAGMAAASDKCCQTQQLLRTLHGHISREGTLRAKPIPR